MSETQQQVKDGAERNDKANHYEKVGVQRLRINAVNLRDTTREGVSMYALGK